MGGFLGSYRHSLDAKGRVSLPAPFRHGSDAEGFVLVRAHPDALTLYPDDRWEEVAADLAELRRRRPQKRHMVLQLTANAHRIVPDAQGRMLIPERLREEVGLDDEALIVGALDRIEIWQPERFDELTASGEEFDELTASIFA
ncbi:MAG TPA: division/cell wall cluster transcriptional repressor MraZ [Gemmatimonadota bacterium]|nr:division/cell wall cluster transcriptional repressor MraZ [Gemmatimonadota bacterium]